MAYYNGNFRGVQRRPIEYNNNPHTNCGYVQQPVKEPSRPDCGCVQKPVERPYPDCGCSQKPMERPHPDCGCMQKPVERPHPDCGCVQKPAESSRPDCGCAQKPVERPHPDCGCTKKPVEICVTASATCPVAMAYVPFQPFEELFDPEKALMVGTVFPSLFKPFMAGGKCR